MPEWDPYYLARGLRRALGEDHSSDGHTRHLQELARREDRRDQAEERAVQAVEGFAVVDTVQQSENRRRLDRLQAKNTEDLMRISEEFAIARERLVEIVIRAYVHSDGRRLYRTQDGEQVYDENGNDVTGEVDPDLIGPSYPTWEERLNAEEDVKRLEAERSRFLEEQRRLDESEGKMANGSLTGDELDALEAEFGAPKAQPAQKTPAQEFREQTNLRPSARDAALEFNS